MMSSGPISIRCSVLPMWNDCPRRSAARTLRQEIQAAGIRLATETRGIGAIVGTATHAGAALLLHERMAKGRVGPESVAADAAVESLKEAFKAEPVTWDNITRTPAQAERTVVRQVKRYRSDVAAKVEPAQVEYRMEAEWGPILLTGHMDLRTQDGVLRDIKGGRSRPNAAQYGGYFLLSKANGLPVSAIIEDGIPRVDPAQEQPPVISRPIDVETARLLAREAVNVMAQQITLWREKQNPAAFPANPNSYLCGPKFCPAWGTEWCQAWKAKQE